MSVSIDDLNIGSIGSKKMYDPVKQQAGGAADCYLKS